MRDKVVCVPGSTGSQRSPFVSNAYHDKRRLHKVTWRVTLYTCPRSVGSCSGCIRDRVVGIPSRVAHANIVKPSRVARTPDTVGESPGCVWHAHCFAIPAALSRVGLHRSLCFVLPSSGRIRDRVVRPPWPTASQKNGFAGNSYHDNRSQHKVTWHTNQPALQQSSTT